MKLKNCFFLWWVKSSKNAEYEFGHYLDFSRMIEERKEDILNVMLVSFVRNRGIDDLVFAMKGNVEDEYFDNVRRIVSLKEFEIVRDKVEKKFLSTLVNAYNGTSEIDDSYDEELDDYEDEEEFYVDDCNDDIVTTLYRGKTLTSKFSNKINDDSKNLSVSKLLDVYNACALTSDDLDAWLKSDDIILGEGAYNSYTSFHLGRLKNNQKEIETFINELMFIGDKTSFSTLFFDKNGRQWTSDYKDVNKLVHLGIGLGLLDFPVDKSLWHLLPDGVPYVSFNKETFKYIKFTVDDGGHSKKKQ